MDLPSATPHKEALLISALTTHKSMCSHEGALSNESGRQSANHSPPTTLLAHPTVPLGVQDVSREGFTLHAQTWGDSITWSINVGWMAVMADNARDVATITDNGRSPGALECGRLTLGRWPDAPIVEGRPQWVDLAVSTVRFPRVLLALSSLDVDASSNARVDTRVEVVRGEVADGTTGGEATRLVVSTWCDSTTWSVGLSWLACR